MMTENTETTILTVKDLDPDQQPREKAWQFGTSVLSTSELWALILRTGTPGNPITELCRQMMRANNGLIHNLVRRERKELMLIKGIGRTKVIQIEAVIELIRRYQTEEIGERPQIRESKDVWKIMTGTPGLGDLDHEEIWALFLNRRNEVTNKQMITSGTQVASIFDVKQIIKPALLENADGLILCHNHPSGNKRPSTQDDAITRALKKACEVFNIRLLDHVIVCADGHYSYRDDDRLV